MHDDYRRPPPPVNRPGSEAEAVEVLCGPLLCVLRVWSEAEWALLTELERPINSEYVVGIGWVGAVPVECMN